VNRHPALLFAALALLLCAGLILSIALGAVRVPPSSLLRLALSALGVKNAGVIDARDAAIILHLRLPRALAAVLVGATLAACGAVMQGLFRNPMASPEVLGVSAGGSLGAVTAISTGLAGLAPLAMPASTVVGAVAASAVIYVVSSVRGSTSLFFVVIAGLAISSLLNGLTSGLLLFSREHEVSAFIFWTMGGLDGRTWQHILYSLPVLVPGIIVLSLFSRELNILAFGEEGAASLGMGVEGVKRLLLGLSALLTGVAISVSGPVGFIGLLVPHLIRLLLGPDHRTLIPASALGGGLFLLLADLAGRSIAPPFEIRVGIVTAVVGSPYLLFLVIRARRRGVAS
jgi:iron complex transport system permease protein